MNTLEIEFKLSRLVNSIWRKSSNLRFILSSWDRKEERTERFLPSFQRDGPVVEGLRVLEELAQRPPGAAPAPPLPHHGGGDGQGSAARPGREVYHLYFEVLQPKHGSTMAVRHPRLWNKNERLCTAPVVQVFLVEQLAHRGYREQVLGERQQALR